MTKPAKTSRQAHVARTPRAVPRREARKIPPAPGAERAWARLRSALVTALRDLQEDQFLVIDAKPNNAFVQFAGQAEGGIRAEAVSNAYLPEAGRLSNVACRHLQKLGWNAPSYVPVEGVPEPADGSPNFYLDVSAPVPHAKLAALAIDSLRRVYLVRHPNELEYAAVDNDGLSIVFPSLRLRRRRS